MFCNVSEDVCYLKRNTFSTLFWVVRWNKQVTYVDESRALGTAQ